MQIQSNPFSQPLEKPSALSGTQPSASPLQPTPPSGPQDSPPNSYTTSSALPSVALHENLTPQQTQSLNALKNQFPDLSETLDTLAARPDSPLFKTDSRGQTTLNHINSLTRAKGVYPQVSPQAVAKQLIVRLNDRSEMFQGPQYTCGSATIQNYMTQHDPGEFTRIVKDLATKGKTTLRDKSSLTVPDEMQYYLKTQSEHRFIGETTPDTREVTDVLFQSAVMKDISIVGGDRAWKGKSDNLLEAGAKAFAWLTDWADYDAQNDDDGIVAKLKGNGGGDPLLIEQLTEAMTGRRFDRDSIVNLNNAFGSKSAFKAALSQVKRGEHELLTLLKEPLHYVLLTDFDPQAETVTYLSTGAYHRDSGESSVTAYETVPLKDFLSNCGALYSPH